MTSCFQNRIHFRIKMKDSERTLISNSFPETPQSRVTFSSPAATLKASSMTEPTAMRTAADECISFHTVSLSTCRGKHKMYRWRTHGQTVSR